MTLLLLGACAEEAAPKDHVDTDADADADTDADADADTDTDADTEASCDDPVTATWSATSNSDGYAVLDLPVDALTDAVQLVVEADAPVTVDYLYDEGGNVVLDWEDWYESTDSLTDAMYGGVKNTVLGWPIREEEGELRPGTWTAWIATLDESFEYAPDIPVTAVLRSRRCRGDALSLPVTIAWAEGLSADTGLVAAAEAAVTRMIEIYAPVGIVPEVRFVQSSVPTSAPSPSGAKDTYEQLYEAEGGEGIVVVIAESIGNDPSYYGEAGSVPGAAAPTRNAAVVLNWSAHAGRDAVFDEAEIELLAETLAHEVGHYVGLYHPVEDGWNYWDALEDTVKCESWQSCEQDLAANLMFPYPVCTREGCTAQEELTAQQIVVMNNYAPAR